MFSANQFKQTRFLFAFVHLKLSMFAYVRFHLTELGNNKCKPMLVRLLNSMLQVSAKIKANKSEHSPWLT